MKKVLVALLLVVYLSSCYTVTRVGNCKYYSPKNLSSKGKQHQLIGF
jgi:hypothetical protein